MKLNEVATIVSGGTPSTKKNEYWNGSINWITPKDLSNYKKRHISSGERSITKNGLRNSNAKLLPKNTVLFTSRAPIGYVAIANEELCTNQGFKNFICHPLKVNHLYLYYWFKQNKALIINHAGGSTFKEISATKIGNIEINLPSLENQNKIAKILSTLDEKIELNNKINNNLLNLINTLYNEKINNVNYYKRVDEIANITIGKTPPRGEYECFTTNSNDLKWISISDLGKCGMYIYDTKEKLTNVAVNKYRVKIIPANTILLSFKLTVGRIAITTEEMTTNEAIAHFNLNDNDYVYYMYSYLNNFDYLKLGSTSSIATAINSKIIKSMIIGVPEKNEILEYNKLIKPLFNKIKINEGENINLSSLRDILLPQLMNGKINLDNIEI